MRVISAAAGPQTARSRGARAEPTQTRLKETLFDILGG